MGERGDGPSTEAVDNMHGGTGIWMALGDEDAEEEANEKRRDRALPPLPSLPPPLRSRYGRRWLLASLAAVVLVALVLGLTLGLEHSSNGVGAAGGAGGPCTCPKGVEVVTEGGRCWCDCGNGFSGSSCQLSK
jgi:hypothetical protein